jgi:hypothetical protein
VPPSVLLLNLSNDTTTTTTTRTTTTRTTKWILEPRYHFVLAAKNDRRADQDHRLKLDRRSDQDHLF